MRVRCDVLPWFFGASLILWQHPAVDALSLGGSSSVTRRQAMGWVAAGATGAGAALSVRPEAAFAAGQLRNKVNEDVFLKTGFVSNPMGISGQSGKARPETGVVLRDGSDVSRDPKTGDVSAELILKSARGSSNSLVFASYSAPWPLATGKVFDVECRDPATGDGAFLAVADTGGRSLRDLPDSVLIDQLMGPTGRFSFYGQPTDIQVRDSRVVSGEVDRSDYRVMDVSFSALSQSTQTEIPRRARVIATVPDGTSQAVMLVGSASALRWRDQGCERTIAQVVNSFRAIPAPETSLKMRAKKRPTLDIENV